MSEEESELEEWEESGLEGWEEPGQEEWEELVGEDRLLLSVNGCESESDEWVLK